MKKHLVPIVFSLLIFDFLLIISTLFIPSLRPYMTGTSVITTGAIFLLLGVILIVVARRDKKLNSKLRNFLILTGFSAAGFFVGVLLHNALYALAMIVHGFKGLYDLLEFFHVIFFLVATILCPLGFLVGLVGSIVVFIKKNTINNKGRKNAKSK